MGERGPLGKSFDQEKEPSFSTTLIFYNSQVMINSSNTIRKKGICDGNICDGHFTIVKTLFMMTNHLCE